ncbi:MAG: acyl-CoA carboxylase subunit beta [Candidatus Comchoanobacterales bacterium]
MLDKWPQNNELFAKANQQIKSARSKLYQVKPLQEAQFYADGRLLPLERIKGLLDKDSELPIASLAGYQDNLIDGAGVFSFIGLINQKPAVLIANNVCQKGGIFTPSGVQKILRSLEIALSASLPVVLMVESGGADLKRQSELFVDTGRIYALLAQISQKGCPVIATVHGVATAGGAYLPGMADIVIMVKNAEVSLAGSALIQAAMGQEGQHGIGDALMHAQCSGLADYLVENDQQAVNKVKQLFQQMKVAPISLASRNIQQSIAEVVPFNFKYVYSSLEVIRWLADHDSVDVFKEQYGQAITTAVAKVGGSICGMIGNNGPIDPESANKVSQFLQHCDLMQYPVVFLQNTTGFQVGDHVEKKGIIKYGSRWIQVMSNVSVPKITLMIGASFGAGSYAMCARGFSPDFIFAWPNARMAVMGAEQAAGVMSLLAEKRNVKQDEIDTMKAKLIDQYTRESMAIYLASRLWVDEVILPEETHLVLGLCLGILTRELSSKKACYGASRV